MADELKYLSDIAMAQLRNSVHENLKCYTNGGFNEYANDPGWDISLGIEFDAERLKELDLSRQRNIAAIDLENSRIVGEAFGNLTPSIANEERVWVRLAHVEAFEYCKARWIDSAKEEDLAKTITDHFFAPTQTGIRDDHAISRLWWNYQIAKTCQPDDVEGALTLILKTADIRSNFVERIWMTSRRSIAAAVLRAMATDPWLTQAEHNFREFMKALNRLGGGIVFEVLDSKEIDEFVYKCSAYAKQIRPETVIT